MLCWSPKKDLRQLIRKPTLRFRSKGVYVGYDKLRLPKTNKVKVLQPSEMFVPDFNIMLPTWTGVAESATVVGDCGAPLVAYGEPTTAIVGIHTLGCMDGKVWSAEIDTDVVEAAVKHFDRPMVQSGCPKLSAPSAPKVLVGLRQKSPLRWVERGSLQTFGSFAGTLPTSRSKVRYTLLGEEIEHERGWVVDAHAPNLLDWRPWRHALLDITGQQYGALS